MSVRYFVMIRYPKGFPIPLVDEKEDIVLFDSREEAENLANKTLMGPVYGFEVYEW